MQNNGYGKEEMRSYLRRSADEVGLSENDLDGLETDSIGLASYSEHNIHAIADRPIARLVIIPPYFRVQSPEEDVNYSQRTRTAERRLETLGGFARSDYNVFAWTGLLSQENGLRQRIKDYDMRAEHARLSQNFSLSSSVWILPFEHLDDSDQSSNALYKNLVSEASQEVLDQLEYKPCTKRVTALELKRENADMVFKQSAKKPPDDESGYEADHPFKHDIVGIPSTPTFRNYVDKNKLQSRKAYNTEKAVKYQSLVYVEELYRMIFNTRTKQSKTTQSKDQAHCDVFSDKPEYEDC